ncbi:MAG: hypothetical protein ACQESP_00955 [Candidatus Muiribacteriota bacterium]
MVFFNKRKGMLLILILLIIAGLSLTIMLTMPRETLQFTRSTERQYIDALKSIENSINSGIKHMEFEEFFEIPVDGEGVIDIIDYSDDPLDLVSNPDIYPAPPEKNELFWNISAYGNYYIRGDKANLFLFNLERKGYLARRVYLRYDSDEGWQPSPVLKNEPTQWVVMVSYISDPEDMYFYRPFQP